MYRCGTIFLLMAYVLLYRTLSSKSLCHAVPTSPPKLPSIIDWTPPDIFYHQWAGPKYKRGAVTTPQGGEWSIIPFERNPKTNIWRTFQSALAGCACRTKRGRWVSSAGGFGIGWRWFFSKSPLSCTMHLSLHWSQKKKCQPTNRSSSKCWGLVCYCLQGSTFRFSCNC